MTWSSDKIKELRKRLGWSQSDLARRLHCESTTVIAWESGIEQILEFHMQNLDLIEKQADMQAFELQQTPLAEVYLDESECDQIDMSSVKQRFSKNN